MPPPTRRPGGIGGTVFNLVDLALVGLAAGPVWGRALPFVFLLTHLSFAVPAGFVSNDVGAGNSGATFGLAATIAGYALARARGGRAAGAAAAVTSAHSAHSATRAKPSTRGDVARAAGILAAGITLIALRDAHGNPGRGRTSHRFRPGRDHRARRPCGRLNDIMTSATQIIGRRVGTA